MTPLFDANAHPALAIPGKKETFPFLVQKLTDAEFFGACAVGLPQREGFEHRAFIEACRIHKIFFPVAAWPNIASSEVEGQLIALLTMGYRAIKIHPRLSGLSVRDPRFTRTLRMAAAADLIVFHCSYQFAGDNALHPVDPLPWLLEAVASAPSLRMVLLHGGTVEMLRYAESIRTNPNVLLDLSYTLQRYEGSSLDQDISYLFRTFDRRICIGTDYPDYEPAQVRVRFEALANGLPRDKRENVGWKNIVKFLKIETLPDAR